ncbi:Putative ribonuclease H protein At1g65750 [Linum perenne]
MDKKLTGWKSKTLSFAGRVTLAVAVLNTIPAFSMQTAKLPERTLELINKRIRVFILGAQNGERKIHLVNWDTVYLPKKLGGLGLRKTKEMNDAYMMKLAWNLLKNSNELWEESVWNLVWKRPGPNRIRHFLWLATAGKLLTNEKRQKPHISNNGNCRRCGAKVEDVKHILRDCQVATEGLNGHQHSSLVARFQKLRERDWETKIIHVYREANHLADCLAAKGHDITLGSSMRFEEDPEVRIWEVYDARGVTESRMITENC